MDAFFFMSEIEINFSTFMHLFFKNILISKTEYYPMVNNTYLNLPNSKLSVKTDIYPFGEKEDSFYPFFHIGDVNGNGLSDLLIGKKRNEVSIYLGKHGQNQFAKPTQIIDLQLPNYELNSWFTDLNNDDKDDFIMKFPSDTLEHHLKILMSE